MTGSQLRRARARAKISLGELARRLGLSKTYLFDLETDPRIGEKAKAQIARAAVVLAAMKVEVAETARQLPKEPTP